MVDAVDLVFAQGGLQVGIELDGGLVIVAEGFFDDEPAPAAIGLGECADARKLGGEGGDEAGRDGQVEEAVAAGAGLLLELVEFALERVEACGSLKSALR